MKHRMKCAVDLAQVNNRLTYHPEIIELHLREEDLLKPNLTTLKKTIERLQQLHVNVYLHHPMKHKGELLDIMHDQEEMKSYYHHSSRILHQICQTYQIQCVLHCHYAGTKSTEYQTKEYTQSMKKEIESILSWSEDSFLWENTIEGAFAYHNPYLLDTIIIPLNLPLVHDISHTFIGVKGDNEKLQQIAKTIHPYVHYLHVVDSLGEIHDGLELGKGKVQWENILPYLKGKPSIYEIALEDMNDATPMARSAEYLKQRYKTT